MKDRWLTVLACAAALTSQPALEGRAQPSPQRIVSTAPSVTEMLFALGVGDRVVAVTTWCRHPEEARSRPKIGGYGTPSLEAILRARPDLVVMNDTSKELEQRLSDLHIPLLSVRLDDLASIGESIRVLSRSTGVPAQGEALVARIEEQVASARREASGRPRPRTLLLLAHSPDALTSLYAVGPRTFLSEMLDAAGGDNVLADVRLPYPQVSVEEVLARDPDVILTILSPPVEATDAAARAQRVWSAYPSLRAVRAGAVRVVVDDTILQPGPRVGEKVALLAAALRGVQP